MKFKNVRGLGKLVKRVCYFFLVYNTIIQPATVGAFTPSIDSQYVQYYQQVYKAEGFIGARRFDEALTTYQGLFEQFEFVFLRDYQVAGQVAYYVGDTSTANLFLEKGIKAGWKWKSIRQNAILKSLVKNIGKRRYAKWRDTYEDSLDFTLRNRVKEMFKKDQRKAFGALFTLSSKAQDRYAEKRFAPHSEKQMEEVAEILDVYGYPGEQLIGNNFWMSTILSHHNSISRDHALRDKWYPRLQPLLMAALSRGEMSPFECGLVDEWYRATQEEENSASYGILTPPSREEVEKVNALRQGVFLRPIELRNQLIDVGEETGIDFYLPGGGWIGGKIRITD